MKVYLDFDGTVVEHAYPSIGRRNPYAIEVIRLLQDKGYEIILNTYRSDLNNGTLEKALDLLNNKSWMISMDKETELLPITNWTKQKINPPRFDIDQMIKNGEIFIDDISYGIPTISSVMVEHPMVDWLTTKTILEEKGII